MQLLEDESSERKMDDTTDPIIPFVQTDEFFQFSPTLHIDQQPPTPLDRLLISTSLPQDQYGIGFADKQPSNSPQPGNTSGKSHQTNERSGEKKKIIHRDIERQRRQEMAALYGSLRSQLPLEYLKGKRSVADQMYEAARYIKYLEKKIKELEAKKDELKRRHGSSNDQTDQPIKCSATIDQEDTVMVNLCGSTGVEVAINCNVDQGLPLGRVLEVLIGEGLSISSCNTTRVNRRLLHSIQCEMVEVGGINATELQQKIKDSKG